MEEVVIQTLNGLGIKGGRDKDYTGVWIEDKKVCAIGLKVTKWISYHGFALNINPDMKYFENIIPCGIKDKGVCSIRDFDSTIDMARVASGVIGSFENVLGVECVDASIVTPENGQNSLLI